MQKIFFTPVFLCCFWIRDPGWVKIRIRDKHSGSATLLCTTCLVWWNIMEPVRVVRGRLQQTLHHQLKEEVENLQQNTLQVSLRTFLLITDIGRWHPLSVLQTRVLGFTHYQYQGWCKGLCRPHRNGRCKD